MTTPPIPINLPAPKSLDHLANMYGLQVTRVSDVEAAQLSPTPCAVCGATAGQPLFQIEQVTAHVVQCPMCGLGWLDPPPNAAEIASFYPANYYGDDGSKFSGVVERLVRWVGSRHARFLARHLPAKARVLDVGCGRGVALCTLADRGLECHGFEVSPEAVQGIDSRIHVRVAPSLAEAAYLEGFFDKVILWHVLEHVPNPRELIAEIHRILKPNGELIVAVPNFSSWQSRWAGPAWFHLDLPRHLFHFPLPALQRLLTDNHFRCLSSHHFSLRQNPFGWIQSALNKLTSLPRNGVYVMLHRHVSNAELPYSRSTRLWLHTLYGLSIPAALSLSVLEVLFRRGATVHVVAKRI